MNAKPEDVAALEAAITEETEAVRALTRALDNVQSSAEALAPEKLESELASAKACSDALALAGSRRARCAISVSKNAGLLPGVPLERVARRLGDRGRNVAALGRDLRGAFEGLARRAGVLSLTVRYGASACGQLLELRRNASGAFSAYGPNGQVSARVGTPGRTA